MKHFFVSCESYDRERVDRFCEDNDVQGIVLGDLFCQKRMFRRAMADLVLLMNCVLSSEKTAVYQAPLYVTSRNWDEVVAILDLMDSFAKISYVIVQDFGTAEFISKNYKNLRLIWGQLGRVRELRFSEDFLGFLRGNGFFGMETSDPDLAQRLRRHGLIPFVDSTVLRYQTLGRICYVKYQLGVCDKEACTTACYSLRAENEAFEMTLDGYMLGKENQAIPSETMKKLCEGGEYYLIKRSK
jgi:hypothetical protein